MTIKEAIEHLWQVATNRNLCVMRNSNLESAMVSAGKFKIDVWKEGYPVWCSIIYEGTEIRLHHNELSDLKYAVEKAMQEARQALPEKYKSEV